MGSGKAPAFQFYPGDWRRDTQVQMASMETRGVWIEMLCCMWDSPQRGELEGNKDEICRLLGCERDVFNRSLLELERLKIADVQNRQENVKIINRRMSREQKKRNYDRLAKQRQRVKESSQENVKTHSSSSSSSSTSRPPRSPKKNDDNSFDKFWKAYPKKVGKGQALKTWEQLLRQKNLPPVDDLVSAIENQISEKKRLISQRRFCPEWKNPSTWLNGQCWEDEITTNEDYQDETGERKRHYFNP